MSSVRQVKTAGELIPGRQLLQQVGHALWHQRICAGRAALTNSAVGRVVWHQPSQSFKGSAWKDGSSAYLNRLACARSWCPSSSQPLPCHCAGQDTDLQGAPAPPRDDPAPEQLCG